MSRLYRTFLGLQATRGRLLAVGFVGALVLLLGAAAGAQAEVSERAEVAYQLVNNLGIALLVPVTALVFASAAFGEPVEDSTLVYLWLTPVARWRLVVAALASTLTIVLPLGVAPVVIASVLTRAPTKLVLGALAASAVATMAYAAIFVGLGLIVRRALAWGLAYVLIWEAVVAGIGTGPARASVRHYARSILTGISGREPGVFEVGTLSGVLIPIAFAAAAFALTSWRLARQDVA